MAELAGQFAGRGVSPVGFLFQALQADRLQVAGYAGVELAWAGRLVLDHLHQQHPQVAAERQLAAEHLEEHHPQRVHVRAPIGRVAFALGLFGRHVGRRSQDIAGHRQRGLARLALGQAEVHDVRLVAGVEHDVARLQIAVDDAVLVGVMERVGHSGTQLGRLVIGEFSAGQPVLKRQSLDQVGDDIDDVAFKPHLVHADDVGVFKLGGGTCLAEKLLGLLAVKLSLAGDLHRHGPIEPGVSGLPHGAEPAGAQSLDQVEMADGPRALGARALLGRMVRGLVGDEAEALAAGRAGDLIQRALLQTLDEVLAMGAADLQPAGRHQLGSAHLGAVQVAGLFGGQLPVDLAERVLQRGMF